MKRQLCLASLFTALMAFSAQCLAINILAPGDFTIPIDSDAWTGGGNNDWPEGEAPLYVVDGDYTTKYLNFAGQGAGFIVTPTNSSTTVQSLKLTTGNDVEANWWRTPRWVNVFGTNEAIQSTDRTDGELESWELISSIPLGGDYGLPNTNSFTGTAIPLDNDTAYAHYKVEFPTLKYPYFGGSLLEIGEVELFESTDGTGTSVISNPTSIVGIWNRRSESDAPAAETPAQLLDTAAGTKYLNFGKENTGLIVTPESGPQVVTSFRIQTANDAPARDPASYTIYGTNDAISSLPHSQGLEESWTQIDSGALNLGDARGAYSNFISINNNQAWASYKIVFPTLKDSENANSLQIAGLTLNTTDPAALTIDKQTGEVSIETTSAISFGGYEITSESFGVLMAENWASVASTTADGDDTWTESSATSNLLAETIDEGGAGDGLEITPGSPYNLGAILPIVPTEFEDITFTLYGADGATIVSQRVEYEGADIPLGDYSGDGNVNIDDYQLFMEVYGSQFERGVDSQFTRYLGGDLDYDFDSDITDYNLFVQYAGGLEALFGTQVPEPSAVLLLTMGAIAGVGLRRVRRGVVTALLAGVAVVCTAKVAESQTFSLISPTQPLSITEPEGQAAESEATGAGALFDDGVLDILDINGELFNTNYDTITEDFTDFRSLIDQVNPLDSPVYVFLDYGSSITTDWFVYAQRSGAVYGADRVGKFEFWFADAPFGEANNEAPVGDPEAVVNISPTDNRLVTSTLYPYSLGGEYSGQYVAMRLTLSELSATVSGTNRPGGHEFRFMDGPTDLVLEVDRETGEMTLKNNLPGAIAISMTSYEINSPAGTLDATSFNGLGDDTGYTDWSVGGGSNAERLIDGNFASVGTDSTIAIGETGLSLGVGFNGALQAEDLTFTWTDSLGRYFDARVVYTGDFPDILQGDYNNDGMVNLADYAVWRNNLGSTVGLPNDPTPAVVDAADYTVWKDNFGASAASSVSGVAAVPEPAGICFGLAALAATLCCRRLRRSA